ncbi:unnamed protein product [Symbiodinium sp. KB8]|nr:unnamed protein product [Symbiodinium sp. KB8]|mmetsp:Transcript_74782/g.178481  ORF Transcript_74782/g.178481 Transcript_74782/m.178481 type:complete len:227 (-) Transcript_74782:532-1212(-)
MASVQVEEVMNFSLVEKKTFLEFIPSQGEPMRRTLSLPALSTATDHLSEPETVKDPVPKLLRTPVDEHGIRCTESTTSSPGASMMRGSCTAWQLASTRGGSNSSLLTTFIGESMHGASSWLLEEEATGDDVLQTEHTGATAPGSPHSVSGTSTTTMGTLQPTESLGSKMHEAKLCRPCAWYWRPGSCLRGAECLHCHLCADGELGKRRFENRKLAKLRKKQSKGSL